MASERKQPTRLLKKKNMLEPYGARPVQAGRGALNHSKGTGLKADRFLTNR
jgi:hypothetical protein